MDEDSSIAELAAELRTHIRGLRPGDRLPSSRALMARHKVSPVTVSRALGRLAAEGLVVTRPGSGTFVAERTPPGPPPAGADLSWQAVALGDRSVDSSVMRRLLTLPPDGTIPLRGGYRHPALRPLRALASASARAARRADAWERPPPSGLAELRGWFARTVGGDIAADDVLITGGGQAALSTTLRAILPPGSPLLVEAPTYPGALAAARGARLRPVPVPTDDHGVRPDLLADIFAMTEARAFYCQPTYHNPTGTTLPPDRREQVLAIARAAGAFVIEDDYARHLAIDPAPPPLVAGDRHGTVVHLTSLTKATAPSLRVSAAIARGPVAERIRSAQLVEAFFPSRPLQEAALELVSSPGWRRHLTTLGAALRRRRDALTAAVARELPATTVERVPGGGPHLWVRLPDGADEEAISDAASRAGVLVGSGRPHFAAEPTAPYLRLTYVAAASVADLAEGVRRLAGVPEPGLLSHPRAS
jgi:DNA-binding transcriptional MocR family regulator